jgi:hypothetical protein
VDGDNSRLLIHFKFGYDFEGVRITVNTLCLIEFFGDIKTYCTRNIIEVSGQMPVIDFLKIKQQSLPTSQDCQTPGFTQGSPPAFFLYKRGGEPQVQPEAWLPQIWAL